MFAEFRFDPIIEQLPEGYADVCGVHVQTICAQFQSSLSEKSEFEQIFKTEKALIGSLQQGTRFHTCYEFLPEQVKKGLEEKCAHFLAFVTGAITSARVATPQKEPRYSAALKSWQFLLCLCLLYPLPQFWFRRSERLKSPVAITMSAVPPSPMTPSLKLDSPALTCIPQVTVRPLQCSSLLSSQDQAWQEEDSLKCSSDIISVLDPVFKNWSRNFEPYTTLVALQDHPEQWLKFRESAVLNKHSFPVQGENAVSVNINLTVCFSYK